MNIRLCTCQIDNHLEYFQKMADSKPQERDELEHRKGHSFALVIDCDMQEEMQAEATDLCVTGENFVMNIFTQVLFQRLKNTQIIIPWLQKW